VSITVRELATWVGGEVAGNGDQAILRACPLVDALSGDITFVEDDRHLHDWHVSKASAAIVRASVPLNGRPLIYVDDPLMAFASIMKRLRGDSFGKVSNRIHHSACVHPSAVIGAEAMVGPFAVIGKGCVIGARATIHPGAVLGQNCHLGSDVTLYPHVVLYDDCVLGDRVVIHANSVIGSDGFGYRPQNGRHVKVPQLGHVEIGDDVEIGAATTIDRGTFGATRIGLGTKIDNLVQIAHNCQIGQHNLLVSQVGIAGSCVTGDYVVMAGQVGVADHITIGERSQLGAQCGVIKDVVPDSRLWGTPARPDKETLRLFVLQEKIPEIVRDLKQLKQKLERKDVA